MTKMLNNEKLEFQVELDTLRSYLQKKYGNDPDAKREALERMRARVAANGDDKHTLRVIETVRKELGRSSPANTLDTVKLGATQTVLREKDEKERLSFELSIEDTELVRSGLASLTDYLSKKYCRPPEEIREKLLELIAESV